METLQNIFLMVYLFIAVVMDFSTRKIKNLWILGGMAAGILFNMISGGIIETGFAFARMLLPLALLPLFGFGILGAGDIKLFMVIAFFQRWENLWKVVASAFILGAIAALCKLIITKGFRKRFSYLRNYILQVASTGNIRTYRTGVLQNTDVIHFSLYIFLGTVLVIGGVV